MVELLEVLAGYLLLKGGLVLVAYYLFMGWYEGRAPRRIRSMRSS